jgi:hypothetical protein
MLFYSSLHSVAWVVSQHCVTGGERLPASVAEAHLWDIVRETPELLRGASTFPGNPYVKVHALRDPSLLGEATTWKVRSLPCAETVDTWDYWGGDRDLAAERECAEIAGDAIVAFLNSRR